jgi:16S rRNA (cytidine1402-2'-O)-methyltransferase
MPLSDENPAALSNPKAQPGADRETIPLPPGLYLVATPIGNLEDMTLRGLRVLKGVDRIACEDTRFTQKLLNHFDIRVSTISCHEHNEQARIGELVSLLAEGGRVAMVSDAGMPGISDPGMRLARAAIEAGIPVIPVPGANAALTALVASGLDTSRFYYAGFLDAKPGARKSELEALAALHTAGDVLTLVLYEAPHRILQTLADVEQVWSAHVRVVVARELTKLHEEFLRGTVAEVRAQLALRERIRGEIVLLIESKRQAREEASQQGAEPAGKSVAERVQELMTGEGLIEKDALKRVARERAVSKSAAYRELQRTKK